MFGFLVARHFGECLLQLLRDGFELLLLGDQLIFQPVHLGHIIVKCVLRNEKTHASSGGPIGILGVLKKIPNPSLMEIMFVFLKSGTVFR